MNKSMHTLSRERERYLSHALEISAEEEDFISQFEKWLPENIIDAHVHNNLQIHVKDVPPKAYSHMLSTFPSFSIEESLELNKIFHPSKIIQSLRFAMTYKGVDHKKANEYLLHNSTRQDRIALFGLPEDIDYTVEELKTGRYAALKMYYSYLEPSATNIYEIFKPEILSVAQDERIPIVLHVPKIITESIEDVLRVSVDFPQLRLAIAHLGSTKFILPGLKEAYERLAARPTIFMDTALNPSPEVCHLALEVFGINRIMYGSDAPLCLIRSKPYLHPIKGQQILTEYPYHWLDKDDYKKYRHIAKNAFHSHWLSLRALRLAIESLSPLERNNAKEDIFFSNAKDFYGF